MWQVHGHVRRNASINCQYVTAFHVILPTSDHTTRPGSDYVPFSTKKGNKIFTWSLVQEYFNELRQSWCRYKSPPLLKMEIQNENAIKETNKTNKDIQGYRTFGSRGRKGRLQNSNWYAVSCKHFNYTLWSYKLLLYCLSDSELREFCFALQKIKKF